MSVTKVIEFGLASEQRTEKQKTAGLRRLLARQLILELAFWPATMACAAGFFSEWLALAVGSVLTAPGSVYGAIRNRLDVTAAFTLNLMLTGAVVSLVTGDPRCCSSAIAGRRALALDTGHPADSATVHYAQLPRGRDRQSRRGRREGMGRQVEPRSDFRRHIRILTAVWGAVFLIDAGVRVALVSSLPVDSVPGISTAQWLVVLGCLLAFHTRYVATGMSEGWRRF